MVSSEIGYSVCLAFAIVLLLGAIGLYYYPAYFTFKNKKIDIALLKSKKLFFILSFVCLLFSFILFDLQFYLNPFNANYIIDSLKTSVDGLHYFLIFGGSVLLAITVYVFASFVIYYFFFHNDIKPENVRKTFWMMALVFVLLILSFMMFAEGNAPYLRYPFVNRIYFGSSGIKLVTSYTGYDWAPAPTNDAFGFEIAFYALCILSGALVALDVASYLLKKLYGENGLLSTVFLIGFPTGIVGCRLWYVIGNWTRDGFDKDPMKIFRVSDGGLAIMGASLAVVVCVIYLLIIKYQQKKYPYTKINYLVLLDIAIPTIILAQAIGRWGNFFNNEVHGEAFEGNIIYWNWLPTFIKNNMHFSNAHRVFNDTAALELLHNSTIYPPLFFVEGITNIIGFLVMEFLFRVVFHNLWHQKDGSQKWYNYFFEGLTCEGSNLGYYLIWYGATRAILEPLRDSNFNMGNDNMWSVYSAYGMIGIGLLIIILLIVWQFKRDHGKWIMQVKEEKAK